MSKRITEILKFCKSAETTVDVGCDHGYIGFELLKSGKTKKLISTDISAPSLKKAQKLISENGFLAVADFRVGDGLDVILENENINQVVIAGMGGYEIVKIMQKYKNSKKVDCWVLQPMNNIVLVRKFLTDNGFAIEKEVVIEDDKFYHILSVVAKEQTLLDDEIYFGYRFWQNKTKDFENWLNYLCEKFSKIIEKIPQNNVKNQQIVDCRDKIKQIIQHLKEN